MSMTEVKKCIDMLGEDSAETTEPSISSEVYDSKNYILNLSRCHKCAHESYCKGRGFNDMTGTCSSYKKDLPDGGFYG